MPLSNEQKMDIMKEAYAGNYQGRFTDLFQEAEAQQGQGMDPNAPHNQEKPESAPTQPVAQTDPVLNPSPPSMAESDRMVESFQAASPNQMPTGERVRDVLNPGDYRKGGHRLVNSLSSYREGMGLHASDYTQGYKKFEEGGEKGGGILGKIKDVKEKLNINKWNLDRIKKDISLDVSLPQAVKNVFNWRENLAENVAPFGYIKIPERLFNTIVNDRSERGTQKRYEEELEQGKDIEYDISQNHERIDLMNMMLNRPQAHNTISKSQYRPTKSKDKDAVYYSSKKTEKAIKKKIRENDGISTGIWNIGKVLGNFTIDRGKDEDGRKYISYYDKWNINPTKGVIDDKTIDKIFGMKSPEIYGRVYLDELEKDQTVKLKRKGGRRKLKKIK
tara:strand:+ start:662 stop:1828 length:1167 start_codon:yes stop_codon:yes gene_type:complete